MSMSIGGFNANYNVVMQASSAKSGQKATPGFDHGHTWKSAQDMDNAWRRYAQEWRGVYSDSFSGTGAEGDGKISQEELSKLLESEFGGMGVKFVDSVNIEDPRAGRFEVFIDEKNRKKMADDPEYRAQVFAVIQSEMGGTRGYSVESMGGVVNDRTTGLSMSIADGNPLYEGVPHSAGGTSASGGVGSFSMSSDSGFVKEKSSYLEQIMEKLEKKLQEKKEQEKRDAAKKAREDLLEISVEASAKMTSRSVDAAGGKDAADDEEGKVGGEVNVLA